MKLLIRNGHVIRWNAQNRIEQLENRHILIEDNRILSVANALPADLQADETIDAAGCAVIPGLINTHHHLYQSLTRCLKSVQNAKLFDWLNGLYEVWQRLDYEAVKLSSQISMAEMLLSGCTTTNDMFYVYPRESDVKAEAVIEGAVELGMRIHAGRGSMSLGRSRGGLPPDDVVQDEAAILKDSERVIGKFHDPKPLAMTRIDLMPCSPFSITFDLLKETRALAKARGVLCHTHVAETQDETNFCIEKFGKRPADYLASAGWTGPDVSWAHCIWLNPSETKLLADTKTAVAHCPSSNMILGSGIPPVCEFLRAKATVGLGVDGSSSNNGGNVIAEARLALLLQRVKNGADSFTAEDALRIATLGGARLLNREHELGNIAPGFAADIAIFDLNTVEFAGAAAQDPLGALMLCHAPRAKFVIVNGRFVVKYGQVATVSLQGLVTRTNDIVKKRFR
ncbi:MAG TPA: 8-oxoguanine deaminase [Verrucomicrobiae bacterium]|nr:8-oxoguanine deaminase [Verrucomicrobiae bacterium]